mgnify:FL=1
MPALIRTQRLGLAAALTAALLLSACGTPPWEVEEEGSTGASESSDATGSSSAAPSATPSDGAGASATPSPAPTLVQIVNDLASGSAQRTLTAGAASLTATYWSDLDMGSWTPDASKPVSLSLIATLDGDAPIYLSRLHVVSIVRDETGTLVTELPQIADDARVTPGYAIGDPFSYSTTILVSPLDESARSVELTFSYEVLIATDAKGDAFAKQTAVDTLTVAITPAS